MKEYILQALGLNNTVICFGQYLPPQKPSVNYFPFEKTGLPDIEFVGEWDDIKNIEYSIYDNKTNKLLNHLVLKKDKNGYIYIWDKHKKKKWKDPNYKYKCFEDGFIFREGVK